MPKPKTSETPKTSAPTAQAMPDLAAAAPVIDAAARIAQTAPAAPPPTLDDAALRKLAESRATVGGKTDAGVADAIYEMLKSATPEQVAQSAADAAKTEASTRKIATSQKDIRKQEKAAKTEERHDAVRGFLKTERAADRFTTGTHRVDLDYDAATLTPVKGKAREKAGGERSAVTKETLAENKVSAFVLVSGTEPTAVVRGQTVKAHPYAYMNGAHPTRPYFGRNYYTDGMTEEDASAARVKAGMSADLTDGQKRDLKNKLLKLGDDPARLLYKLGKDDSTTVVTFSDGRQKVSVKELIASLDAPTPSA